MPSITSISPEALSQIFQGLDFRSATRLRQTCSYLYKIGQSSITQSAADQIAHRIYLDRNFDLEHAPDGCKKSKIFAERVLCKNGVAYQFLDPSIKFDRILMKTALASAKIMHPDKPDLFDQLLSLMPKEEHTNLKAFIGSMDQCDPTSWLQNGLEVFYSNDLLHDDKEVVLVAVQKDYRAFRRANKELKKDKDFVLKVVSQNGKALMFACKRFRSDREVVFAAVQQCVDAFEAASDELKRDEDFVLKVVGLNGLALEHAGDEQKKKIKVVLTAVRQNGLAYKFGNVDRQFRREVLLAAARQNASVLEDECFYSDEELPLGGVQENGLALQYTGDRLKFNRKVALAVVRENGLALQFVGWVVRNEKVVLAAVQQNGLALEYAGIDKQQNEAIVLAAVRQNGLAYNFSRVHEKMDDERVWLAAKQQNSDVVRHRKTWYSRMGWLSNLLEAIKDEVAKQ
jgi:hypothetical protein